LLDALQDKKHGAFAGEADTSFAAESAVELKSRSGWASTQAAY
jgi:hypothetical protein